MARLFLQAAVAAVLLPTFACVLEPEESPFDFQAEGWSAWTDDEDDDEPSAEPESPSEPETQSEPAAPEMIVFVTSLAYTADLGGLEGADEICAFEAEAAQLPGKFRAWLSSSTEDAIDRITGDGPWHDLQGNRLFNNHAHLRTAPLRPIEVDPFGEEKFWSHVWTGTGVGGRLRSAGTCGDWTSEDWLGEAGVGVLEASSTWTDAGPNSCVVEQYLYCFEVE